MFTGNLVRYWQGSGAKFGVLKINDLHLPIYTLELPWRDNNSNTSCIPAGSYKVVPYSSEKFPNVYELKDVLGRKDILIHQGNYPKDTHGCILVGLTADRGVPMVGNSVRAIDLLRQILGKDAMELRISEL